MLSAPQWNRTLAFPALFGPDLYKREHGRVVRIPSINKNCAVLIGTGDPTIPDHIGPWGTGFLVGIKLCTHGGVTWIASYLVTARHVIADNCDAPFDVRLNRASGGSKCEHVETPRWVYHPDDNTVDVAVHYFEVPAWAEVTFIPGGIVLEAGKLQSKNIGEGDATYTVGLWKFLPGVSRNQPFVYSGHIGLMPEGQKLPTNPWLKEHGSSVLIDGYLTEGEPMDGASGSPVFVRRTIPMDVTHAEEGGELDAWLEGTMWLLGLNHGAWFERASKEYQIQHLGQRGLVSRGVNIVVPATKIAEVLDNPVLVEERRKLVERITRGGAAMPTRLIDPLLETTGTPNHREAFTSLLDAAARTKPQGD